MAGSLLVIPRGVEAADARPQLSDPAITAVVEAGLRYDRGVAPNTVDAGSSHGIVTLSGAVSNLLAKERAVAIAESIRGVRGVVDRITVTPVLRSDRDIRDAVLMMLSHDPATASYHVSASVKNAVATLAGVVDSYAAKRLAVRLAKGVKGMKDVRDDLTIDYARKRSDEQIAADARARLAWDLWLNGDSIKTAVKGGAVTLSGLVGSAVGKSRAYDDAWVNGVTAVDDAALEVDPRLRDDARHRPNFAVKTDGDIKAAVEAAFQLDPRVSRHVPDVSVEGGGVILTGTVENLKAKASAEQDAHDIGGVWRVDNLIKVRPQGPVVDVDMEKQLKTMLAWDPSLDGSAIDVAVINRVAYLTGAVDSRYEMVEAEEDASRVEGLLWVRNRLKVEPDQVVAYDRPYSDYHAWPYYRSPFPRSVELGPPPYPSDAEIKAGVVRALFWSPFVAGDTITVTVHGGVATLSGTVDSWIGWREADEDARRIAGDVINRLVIRKGR
ncbi:MAG TPA: BON domain-containing protein [Polyangia bacterium]